MEGVGGCGRGMVVADMEALPVIRVFLVSLVL
jgi:hypothetical protein